MHIFSRSTVQGIENEEENKDDEAHRENKMSFYDRRWSTVTVELDGQTPECGMINLNQNIINIKFTIIHTKNIVGASLL